MVKRLLIWSITLILIFALLVTVSRAIGGSVKSGEPTVAEMLAADSYLGPHGWCWRDICPGATIMRNAAILLRDYSNGDINHIEEMWGMQVSWEYSSIPQIGGSIDGPWSGDPIEHITIVTRLDHIPLGDIMQIYG